MKRNKKVKSSVLVEFVQLPMEENGGHTDVLAGIMADAADLDQLEAEVSNKEAAENEMKGNTKRKDRSGPWTSTSSKHRHSSPSSSRSGSTTSGIVTSVDKEKRPRTERDKEEQKEMMKESEKKSEITVTVGGIAWYWG